MSTLNPDTLQVDSFDTTQSLPSGGFCCTGCVSGCGIFPTNGGCASGGDSFDGCGTVPMLAA